MSSGRKETFIKLVKISLWIVGILSVLVFLGFLLLSSVGGSSKNLKEGLEQFFISVTRKDAYIGKLNSLTLVPMIEMDIEDLALYDFPPARFTNKKDSAEKTSESDLAERFEERFNAKPWMLAGHVVVRMKFWDVFWGRKKIIDFQIENTIIKRDGIGSGVIFINEAALKREEGGGAFVASGMYNDLPFDVRVPFVTEPDPVFKQLFQLNDNFKVNASIGDIEISGVYASPRITENGQELRDMALLLRGEKLVEGTIGLNWLSTPGFRTYYGSLSSGSSSGNYSIKISNEKNPKFIEGGINIDSIKIQDIESGPAYKLRNYIECSGMVKKSSPVSNKEEEEEAEEDTEPSEETEKAKLEISIKEIDNGGIKVGPIDVSVVPSELFSVTGGSLNNDTDPFSQLMTLLINTKETDCSVYTDAETELEKGNPEEAAEKTE